MKKLSLLLFVCLLWTNVAWGHGNISKLPSSVQVMQYKMKLYMNKNDLNARNGLAMALYRTGKLDKAVEELTTVLKADPQNFDATDGMGVILIKKEKYKEALEYLQKALALKEKDIMVHVHLAVVYDKLNLADKSKAELETAGSLVSDATEIENIDKELKIVSGY